MELGLGQANERRDVGRTGADAQYDAVSQSNRQCHVYQIIQEQHPPQAVSRGDFVLLQEERRQDLRVRYVPADVGHGGPQHLVVEAAPAPHQQAAVHHEEGAHEAENEEVLGVGDLKRYFNYVFVLQTIVHILIT